MYQRPDFVKVSLEIKDNFAAYVSGCYRNSWAAQTNNEQVVGQGNICRVDEVITYASGETDYQCFLGKNSY